MFGKKKEEKSVQDEVEVQRRTNSELVTQIMALRHENETLLTLNDNLRKNLSNTLKENEELKEQLSTLVEYLAKNNINADVVIQQGQKNDNTINKSKVYWLSEEDSDTFTLG